MEDAYLLALHRIEGLGPVRLKALLDYYKRAKEVWHADPRELINLGIPQKITREFTRIRQELDPKEYQEKLRNSGIKWLTIFDDRYPEYLRQIYDPPVVFYYKGKLPLKRQKLIAIVGTRKMTDYGKLVTAKFTRELVMNGIVIVSGLARGVDGEAHRAAIEGRGQTVAVLGSGLDHIYPPENLNLAEKICQGSGAVISELPPDFPPTPGSFPARNRIISGLSLAVVVTEAAENSGSLITARCALEQGRDVFAVPGPITSELSKGPSFLIKQGARLVTEAEEILQELGIVHKVC